MKDSVRRNLIHIQHVFETPILAANASLHHGQQHQQHHQQQTSAPPQHAASSPSSSSSLPSKASSLLSFVLHLLLPLSYGRCLTAAEDFASVLRLSSARRHANVSGATENASGGSCSPSATRRVVALIQWILLDQLCGWLLRRLLLTPFSLGEGRGTGGVVEIVVGWFTHLHCEVGWFLTLKSLRFRCSSPRSSLLHRLSLLQSLLASALSLSLLSSLPLCVRALS